MRGVLVVLVAMLVISSGFAIAAEDEGVAGPESDAVPEVEVGADEDLEAETDNEFADAQLEVGAGITPDSGAYFIEDKILSQFRGDVENREKKIAEVREMVREGNIEAARESLERYREYAKNLESEADPEQRDEARRSAAAIRNALKEIEGEIPEGQRKEFVGDVLEQEDSIVTAVEIADKIKELCTTLSKLDPIKYEETCVSNEDGPKWKKKLDRELTAEQEKEAKVFFRIMSQCFKDATKCECEKISITAFAEKCSDVVPEVIKCQNGDESACESVDEKTAGIEELLPDYLQDVLAEVEDQMGDAEHEMYVPEVCQEAGAKDRKSCMKVMIQNGGEDGEIPEECRSAMVEAIDKGAKEKEMRAICEEIMYKESAPEECIEAGIKNHKECGRFMFAESAPQECKDAGLTGEKPSDHRKCEKIMQELRGEEGREGPNRGPGRGMGINCKNLEDSERLKCYDNALQNAGEFRDDCRDNPEACKERFGFEDRRGEDERRGMPPECEGKSPEECRGIMEERFGRPPEEFREGQEFREGPRPEGEFREGEFEDRRDDFVEGSGETRPDEGSAPDSGSESSSGGSESGSGESSGGGESGSSGDGGGEGTVSGGVISGRVVFGDKADNSFLKYFFRFR